MGDTRITFDVRKGLIVIEGPGDELGKLIENVRAVAPSLKEIRIVSSEAVGPSINSKEGADEDRPKRRSSLRDFARQFSLENTSQRIAVIAHHAIKQEGKPSFTVKEMNDWFGLCGFKKPTQMPVALSDAKRKYGYVENKGRDQWTIATGGENLVLTLVESLPNSDE
jgi:hypothetical protein